MENIEKTTIINLTCDSDYEYADALMGIVNKKLLLTEKRLWKVERAVEKEQDAHGETRKALEKERDTHGETKEALKKEQDAHDETKKALKKEQDAHDETKKALKKEQDAHGETKKALKKEQDAHGETKEVLKKEQDAHDETKKALEKEQDAHDETKKALKKEQDAHGETKKVLKKEQDAHGETKEVLKKEQDAHDETKKALKKEQDAHDETKKALKKEQDAHGETKEALNIVQKRVSLLDNNVLHRIQTRFNEIASLLSYNFENLTEESKELKKFVEGIIHKDENGNYDWSLAKNLDELVYSFSFGDNYLSRILSLIWWRKQEDLDYMTSCIPNVDKLPRQIELINEILSIEGHSINMPENNPSKVVDNYEKYDDDKSNFMKIFVDNQYEKGTLCEVYLASIDGNKGKCYIYWK